MNCNICKHETFEVWNIKNSPIPNFYSVREFECFKSDACISYCTNCFTIQNNHNFSDDEIFSSYDYRSPKTALYNDQVKFISDVINNKKIKNVLEVGCNNGLFIRALKQYNSVKTTFTGIDPIQETRKENEINFVKGLMNAKNIEKLITKKKFDLVILRHVFAHNKNVSSLTKNIVNVLGNKSYIYIENADLEMTYSLRDFSQFYSEHFYAFSKCSIQNLFSKHLFYTEYSVDWEIHNGSFGMLLTNTINKKQEIENKNNILPYNKNIFKKVINEWVSQVKVFFYSLKSENRKIYLWGCSAKTTFILNIFKINTHNGTNIFDGAFDSTQEKLSRFIPGTNIKVMPEPTSDNFIKDSLIIIGARNFEEQLTKKIKACYKNAQIIIPLF